MDSTIEIAVAQMLRIGTVSDLDLAGTRARVFYKDRSDMTSGWLKVLQRGGEGMSIVPDGSPTHSHPGSVSAVWMPKINDTVLVIYKPDFNADGYILGVL